MSSMGSIQNSVVNTSSTALNSSVSKNAGERESLVSAGNAKDTDSVEMGLKEETERNELENKANSIFNELNTGFALKFHEKSGEWYAVIENKITKEVVKEVPPKYILDLHVKLRDMIGVFLDKKI